MRTLGLICTLPLLMGALLTPAYGQADIRESVAGFAPSYFAGSSPSSAYEMVLLLPGFRFQEGDITVRGYSGALGNVLIDGRPPASKEDTLETLLKRIPAASVLRIELIRPGAAGIDMQGFALMANVVRRASAAPTGRVEVEHSYFPSNGAFGPKLAGEMSLGSEYILDLSGAIYRNYSETGGGTSLRNRLRLDGSPVQLGTAFAKVRDDVWTGSATWRQPLAGGKLRLNGLYKDTRYFSQTRELRTFPNVQDARGQIRDMTAASEFGVQYQRPLWDGGEAELIAIRRASGKHGSQTILLPTGPDSTFTLTNTSESILRGALRHHTAALSLEAGGETALNTLNNSLAAIVGGVPVSLPGANVRISEARSEFSGLATWQAMPDLTLEAGLRYEMSTLKQRTVTGLLRKDLSFLKPHVQAIWKPAADDQIRVLYERRAGQLDFGNFTPNVNLASNTISAGNANLEPDTLWHAALSWEHRFSPGSLVLTARHEEISNVVDRVAVPSPAGPIDGVGNLGHGRRNEYQADFLLPLDRVDLPGMTLQGTALRRFSRVLDPTTGLRRSVTDDLPIEMKATLTHDIADMALRWGLVYNHVSRKTSYKFNEIGRMKYPESWDVFVEHKPADQWLVRFAAKNVLDRAKQHSRELYFGPRGSSPHRYNEDRPAFVGARLSVNLQRTF